MDLSVRRLRMLRELHRRGTLTAAASALHYTASAVSQQLALLERDVGAALFERVGRRTQLTEVGTLLAEHAEEILDSVERATVAVEEARATSSVKLRAGVFATVAAGLLPTALGLLAREHPGIQLRTREVVPEAAPSAVRDGELDLAFVIDYADAPMPWDSALRGTVIAVERLHAAVPAGTVAAGSVSLPDLADQPWILPGPRTHFGRAVRVACQRAGLVPRIDHEVDEQATAMAMVAAGLGVTLVSDLALTFHRSGVDIVALTSPVTRTLSVAVRATSVHRTALDTVTGAVLAAAAELGLGADAALGKPGSTGHN